LNSYLRRHERGDTLLVCAASSGDQHFSWLSRRNDEMQGGCGVLSEYPVRGVALSAHGRRIFAGNRTPYVNFLGKLPPQDQTGWARVTFDRDCRASGAFGLDDEQRWCETAYAHDGKPETPSVYIVHVLGSNNYFGYFNILWEHDDVYCIKSCHDLQKWASLYVPRMYADRDVERWVFLRQEDFDTFWNAAPDYRRAFTLMHVPFA
jgi:hypothetical protein